MRPPGFAGSMRPLTTGPVGCVTRRTAAARTVPGVPPVGVVVAAGATPPDGVIGVAGVAGVAGVSGPSGARLPLDVTVVKNAHVSNSPNRERSCGPVTFVVPFVPTTCARTIRGETPRWTTLMPRKRPLTSPRSLAPACVVVSVCGVQRWRGARSSYGSSTPFSHGFGAEPTNEFSTFSVLPPDVEKKKVVTGWPAYVTTWPAVAATAASVEGRSAATPLYICERVSAYWSKPSLIAPARDVIAYVRAATACAFSASAGHAEGLSADTTPRT